MWFRPRRRLLRASTPARLVALSMVAPPWGACSRVSTREEPTVEARPLATATAVGNAAWLRGKGPPIEWASDCRWNLDCPAVKPLPTCGAEVTGVSVAELARQAPAMAGKVVSVRGPLGVEGGTRTM